MVSLQGYIYATSGIGTNTMMRKYGLAADNIIDAHFMNSKGKIVNRKSMGEDLFWGLRGGGGASFGVTVFTIRKNLDNEGIEVLNKLMEHIASRLPEDLFIRIVFLNTPKNNHKIQNITLLLVPISTIVVSWKCKEVITIDERRFPELRLKEEDCTKMCWINSTLYFSENNQKY